MQKEEKPQDPKYDPVNLTINEYDYSQWYKKVWLLKKNLMIYYL